jgi:hypothetical protein
MNRWDVLVALGVILLAVGAGLIYVPAGIIVAGAGCVAFGAAGAIVEGRAPADRSASTHGGDQP